MRQRAGSPMARLHTDREYESELRRIREMILLMGAKVEEMLSQAMKALVERNGELAQRMLEVDRHINRLEVDVDDMCLRVLARRQPVASDLRFLTMALKVVTDLERMGDLGVNICERIIELNEEPVLLSYTELVDMAETAQEMLHEALDAFASADAERAQAIVLRDSNVDAHYAALFRELLDTMMDHPQNIYRATRIQSIAKYIERIADHATNLAEMVVFMVRGKDIRHGGRLQARGATSRPPPVAPNIEEDRGDESLRDLMAASRRDTSDD